MRPRPFAIERRPLKRRTKPIEIAASRRRVPPEVDLERGGSLAADMSRILRGRTDFPKLLWGEVL